MESDIKLKANGLTQIEGRVLKVTGIDIEFDNKDRRGRRNRNRPRRALVHDFQDGLTLNWANDYPGGVTINNGKIINASLEGKISAKNTIAVEQGVQVKRKAILHVQGSAKFDGGFDAKDIRLSALGYDRVPVNPSGGNNSITNVNVNLPGNSNAYIRQPKSLVTYIKNLEKKIKALEAKVKQLEAV